MHEFRKSLSNAHEAGALPFWETIYREFFPSFDLMVSHDLDGWHQRVGIDRSVILTDSKRVRIDEKVRWKRYPDRGEPDVLLEVWGDKGARTPGWVCKPLMADYICYAVAPAGIAFMLPVIELQALWFKKQADWLPRYKLRDAQNNGYVTQSCPVPSGMLLQFLGFVHRVEFERITWESLEIIREAKTQQKEFTPDA